MRIETAGSLIDENGNLVKLNGKIFFEAKDVTDIKEYSSSQTIITITDSLKIIIELPLSETEELINGT